MMVLHTMIRATAASRPGRAASSQRAESLPGSHNMCPVSQHQAFTLLVEHV